MSADLAWQPRDSQPLSAQGGGSDVMESQFTTEASNQQKENASQMPKVANAPSSTPSATGLNSISATGTPSSSGASGTSHVQEWDPTAFLNPSMFSSDLVSNSPVTTNPPQNMTTHFQLDPHSHPHHLQQIAPHPQSHIQNNSVPATSGSLSHPGPSSATPTMNPLQSNQSATFGQDSFQDGYMQEPVSYGQTYDMYHASQLPRASFEGGPYRPVPSQQATDLSAPMSQLGISQDYMFLPSNGAFQPNMQNGAHLHGSQHPHNQMHNQHLLTQNIPTIPSQTPFDYHPGPHDPQGSLDRISPHARLSPYGNSPISNQNFSNQQDFVGGPGSSDHFGPSDQFTDHFGGLERRPSTAGSVHSLHADFPGDLAIPSQSLMGGAQGGPGGVVPSALHAFHQRNRNGSTSSYHPQLFSSDPGREFMNLNPGPGGASSFGSNVYSGHHQQQFLPEQTFHIAPHALQSDSSRIRSNTGLSTASESGSSGLGSISYPLSEQSAGGPPSEVAQYIRPLLQQYMDTPNRLGFGERTVIVMASKVAQKSYRQERRFLCPPPTAIMIGNAWWTESSLGRDDRRPPRVTISISGESVPPESSVEWSSTSGKPIEPGEVPPLPSSFAQEDISSFQPNGPSTQTFIGRAVGKQLFISDDKQKKVEALVKIVAQGTEDEPERVLGVFPSKPIKVISKPSKKRQSAKNMELCINHGSTVSLFHRLRAQTVSTKYLCVSGSGMSFKGSDGASMPGVDPAQRAATKPSFVVKIGTWDPFIIYIVDMNKPPVPDAAPMPPPYPEYPIPPPNVINMMQHGSHIPIYYNQTVVLQCLTSGVVSPVLIIRKVDHDTTVVGGGLQEGAKGVPDHFCAPGEVCGDPVSQLHKIAFEVYDPNQSAPAPGSPGPTNAFLSCIVDKVNTYKPSSGRTWNHAEAYSRSQSPSYPPPDSPAASSTGSLTDYFSSGGSPVDSSGLDYLSSGQVPSSDGGRVGSSRRAAKRSNTNASAPIVKTTSKARKRVNSIGSDASGSEYVSPSTRFGLSDQSMSSGALWSIDIGENAVWTIVGTEQIRYNFYVPPGMPGARASGVPLKPVTPFPNIVKYLPPDRAAENPVRHGGVNRMLMNNGMRPDPRNESLVTIYGENFSKTDPPLLFFGTELSPFVDVRCQEVLACIPPPLPSPLSSGGAVNGNGVDPSRVAIESGGVPPQSSAPRPIFIARADGVIYPSSILFYSQ